MVGNQHGFIYSSKYDLEEISTILTSSMIYYLEEYSLIKDDILYVELIFRNKDKIWLSEFTPDLNKALSVTFKSKTSDLLELPVSIKLEEGGSIPLQTKTKDGLVYDIITGIDGKVINFFN
jgi:hypothetical protein